MKVMLLNGSPHKDGTTAAALAVIEEELNVCGIETENFRTGASVKGCLGCGKCHGLKKCVIEDGVNEFNEKMKDCDGLIVGTPVYYAAASGQITSFLNRAFCSAPKEVYRFKPAASVSVARRAGCTSAFDQLNKYFAISEMPIVTSVYWNMVFGAVPSETEKDEEGRAVMKTLARNMAYMINVCEKGKEAGIEKPEPVCAKTNFIR